MTPEPGKRLIEEGDEITIRRVANGYIVTPYSTCIDLKLRPRTHIFAEDDIEFLFEHLAKILEVHDILYPPDRTEGGESTGKALPGTAVAEDQI